MPNKKVFVSGCYDLLHSGHIEFFIQASRYGDLYVGIGSDETYLEYKHRRPMFPQEERLFMVKSIKYVKDAYINAGSGWLLIVALVLISFFMSLMFPTIYGLSLGGIAQSEHPDDAKLGASGLIMAILGGALLTPLQGLVSDNSSIYTSYIIPAICFVVVTLFAAYAVKTNKRIYA